MTLFEREWWHLSLPNECSLDRAGIYEWRIGDESLYVGKSSRLSSRLREYPNNVRKLIDGQPYRKNKPNGFREVHRELRHAHDAGLRVSFTVLENCERQDLNARERHWIMVRLHEADRGGPRLLNVEGLRLSPR